MIFRFMDEQSERTIFSQAISDSNLMPMSYKILFILCSSSYESPDRFDVIIGSVTYIRRNRCAKGKIII